MQVCDPCSCEWQFTKCGHAHEMTDRFARRFTRPFCAQMIVFYFFSPRITRSVVYGPRPRNTLDLYLPRHHLRDLQDPVPVVIYLTGARGGLGASYTSYVDHPLLGQMWRIDLVGPNLYDCPLMSATRHDAGGAWIIGYKAWGSLLARRLSRYGVIVCCLDYRNFPQAGVHDCCHLQVTC